MFQKCVGGGFAILIGFCKLGSRDTIVYNVDHSKRREVQGFDFQTR